MDELVFIENNKAVTTSLMVAEYFEKRHNNVLRDINKLDCSPEFAKLNFERTFVRDKSNRENPMYYMTKDGFIFLVMGYTGKKAATIKENYIKAFNQMESFIQEKQSIEWQESRRKSKLTRNSETDVIKELVKYAKDQGSKNSNMLYMTYSKLANKMADVKGRDNATIGQLNELSIYEKIILNIIRTGMVQGLHYKEIYKMCKERCVAAKDVAMLGGM